MQLFAGELTNQNREYYKVNGNKQIMTARPILAKFPNITSTINPKLYEQHRMITCTNTHVALLGNGAILKKKFSLTSLGDLL